MTINPTGEVSRRVLKHQDSRSASLRVSLISALHGSLTPSGDAASLIVLEFSFLSLQHKERIKSAAITVQVANSTSTSLPSTSLLEPEVRGFAPQGIYQVFPTESTITKTAKLGLPSARVASVGLNASWETRQTTTKQFGTRIVGVAQFVGRTWGEPNAISWVLDENESQKDGIDASLRTAILFKRHSKDDEFELSIQIKTKVDRAFFASNFYGTPGLLAPSTRFDPRDPPFPATSIDVLSSLEGVDLLKIARVGALELIEPTNGEGSQAKAPDLPKEPQAPKPSTQPPEPSTEEPSKPPADEPAKPSKSSKTRAEDSLKPTKPPAKEPSTPSAEPSKLSKSARQPTENPSKTTAEESSKPPSEEPSAPNPEEPSKEERREKLRDDVPKRVVDSFQYQVPGDALSAPVTEPPQNSVEEAPAVPTAAEDIGKRSAGKMFFRSWEVERESDSTDREDSTEGGGKGVHSPGGKAPRKRLVTIADRKSAPNTGGVGPEESSIEEPEDASSQKPVGSTSQKKSLQTSLHEASSSLDSSSDDGSSEGSVSEEADLHSSGLGGRRKIARTLLAISDRLGSANPDQQTGPTAFREVESWSASSKKDRILLDFSTGVYTPASYKFKVFETLTFLNLYNYQDRLVKLNKKIRHQINNNRKIQKKHKRKLATLLREYHEAIQAFKDLETLVKLSDDAATYTHSCLSLNLNDARYDPDDDDKGICDLLAEPPGPPPDSVRKYVQGILNKVSSDNMSFADQLRLGMKGTSRNPKILGHLPRPKSEISEPANTIARFLVSLAGGVFLLAPMCELTYVKAVKYQLISVVLWVLFFSFAIAASSKATNQELLLATAAYAAVLVVFIGRT